MKLLSLIVLVTFLASSAYTEESPPVPAENFSSDEIKIVVDTEETKFEESIPVPRLKRISTTNETVVDTVGDEIESDDWKCVEIGPKRDEDTRVTEGVEEKATHFLSHENILELTKKEKYNSDDISCIIDRIIGDKYERYPMNCTQLNNSSRVYTFFDHPFVINNRFSKTKAIKSYSGSHAMLCEIYQPEGFMHQNETKWIWYKKIGHRQWQEINDTTIPNINEIYEITKNYTATKLKIKYLTGNDRGEYKCMAINSWGDHEHVFDLRVMSFVSLVVPFLVTAVMMFVLSAAIHFRENMVEKKEILKIMNQELEVM